MPGTLFTRRCHVREPNFNEVKKIAREFQTTLTATSIRFVQVTSERCALVWSEAGRVKWAVRSPDFPGWIERGRQLSGHSHAADVFNGKEFPDGFQPVPQTAWLDQHVSNGGDLQEETLRFDRLGAALSMLWLPAEVDDDDGSDGDGDDPRW